MDLLHKALERNPQSFLAQANLGKALLLAGQLERAEPFLREALQLRPDRGVTRRDLGLILLRTDRSAEAREHLRQAARDIPDDPAVHNYLGTALAVTGDLPAAIAEFQRALTLDPRMTPSGRTSRGRARAWPANKDPALLQEPGLPQWAGAGQHPRSPGSVQGIFWTRGQDITGRRLPSPPLSWPARPSG